MIMKSRLPQDLPRGEERSPSREKGALPSDLLGYLRRVEDYVVEHPGASLAGAFAVGVVIAWWIIRR
jgi:ElaB/YqjD/DUF883 family membrane-anchored ribosome-binding protein